jgi:hypothetical protein
MVSVEDTIRLTGNMLAIVAGSRERINRDRQDEQDNFRLIY